VFSNKFPKCDKDICIEILIPHHTHTNAAEKEKENGVMEKGMGYNQVGCGHSSDEFWANVCCSLFAHVIEVVSSRAARQI